MSLFPHELRNQMRLYVRSRELAFFTFLLPIVIFVLLGSVYGEDEIEGVKGSRYLLAGMLGYGVVATVFAGLAIVLVIRRESGVLKRLRATPLPAPTYIAAMLTTFLTAFALEVVCLVVLARVLFDAPLPGHAFSLALSLALGAASFAALGIGLSGLVRSAEGSSAVVNAIYLPMAFLSGSFFSPNSFPDFLRTIAEVLPLTYFIQLVRDVMLHGDEIWSEPGAVAGVAAWGVVGLVVAVRRFRWEPRES
ncbi:MAG: ABC transporter permease [Actinomycetota bacterium]|nr:ABC transporter permease [Actinomycetota bacterium]